MIVVNLTEKHNNSRGFFLHKSFHYATVVVLAIWQKAPVTLFIVKRFFSVSPLESSFIIRIYFS